MSANSRVGSPRRTWHAASHDGLASRHGRLIPGLPPRGDRRTGRTHNTIVVTTTYGKTSRSTPTAPGPYGDSPQPATVGGRAPHRSRRRARSSIPTANAYTPPRRTGSCTSSPSPAARRTASGAWPVSITRDATHRSRRRAQHRRAVGDRGNRGVLRRRSPLPGPCRPDRAPQRTDRLLFNTLCANGRGLNVPSTCSASDSAILSRAGAVVEPGGARILIERARATWNGTTDFGDSVIELTVPGLACAVVHPGQPGTAQLERHRPRLECSGVARQRPRRRRRQGRHHARARPVAPDGHPPRPGRLGGELQRLSIPGGGSCSPRPPYGSTEGIPRCSSPTKAGRPRMSSAAGGSYSAGKTDTGTSPGTGRRPALRL